MAHSLTIAHNPAAGLPSSLEWQLRCVGTKVRNTVRIGKQARQVFRNWPYFWLSRFQQRPGTLALRNGLRFLIRPQATDRSGITEVFILNSYGPVPQKAVVIDIGANIGAFSLLASQRASVVYSVEPVRSNFEMLRRNVDLNRASNVRTFRLALSDHNGAAEIRDSGVTSSLCFATEGAAETVPTMTLEKFFQQNGIHTVDYLKMDCEGAEWSILLSTPPEVLSRIRHLEMEFHRLGDDTHPRMLCDHLRAAGFECRTTNPDLFNGCIVAHRAT